MNPFLEDLGLVKQYIEKFKSFTNFDFDSHLYRKVTVLEEKFLIKCSQEEKQQK